MKLTKELLVLHMWKSLFLSYFEDMNNMELSETARAQAEMGVYLIPKFLHDFGFIMLDINRVDYYNYNINWQEFKKKMNKEHPYLNIKVYKPRDKS
jgi:hypothetical protein